MLAKLTVKTLDAYSRFTREEEGAALVEYGMLVGLIAVVCVVAVGVLGTTINAVFLSINTSLAAV